MKLTEKDKQFIERLRTLFEEKDLRVDLKENGVKRLVLRKNYGTHIETCFGLTRQGVRWRFQRLFGEIYIDAYLTILWIESHFGTELRDKATAIAKQRFQMHKNAQKMGEIDIPRR